MAYRYLDEIATADAAFEAWGASLEEMFVSAGDATLNVMVRDLASIESKERREISLKEIEIDILLFELLQEIIFYKDAQSLLLRIGKIQISRLDDHWTLTAECYGEEIDRSRHELAVDVKAVTLHHFHVGPSEDGWKARVILDI